MLNSMFGSSSHRNLHPMHEQPSPALVRLRGATRRHVTAAGSFCALDRVDLDVHAGECVAVVGPSGSGKTTLAHLLTGIEQPTEGEVLVDGQPLHALSQDALAAWRGRGVGIVFQFFQLLPTLTVAENVMLPMDFRAALPRRERRARALALLERLRIADQADKLPAALSGGQQQRAAIARALANDPALIVADEPTGNLDSASTKDVLRLFHELHEVGRTIVLITHEHDVAAAAGRTISILDGQVAEPAHAYEAIR
jgi:putative ABC transport system ATP-binding protein